MSEKLVTPVDELTGIPLPPIYRKVIPRGNPEHGNEHHAWHPSDAPLFGAQSLASLALRNSIQWLVDPMDHNMAVKGKDRPGYHDLFEGPKLPNNEQEVFEICVFSSSGARSRYGIDLSRGSRADEPVPLSDKQWDILSLPAQPPSLSPSRIIKMHESAARAYDKLIDPTLDKDTWIKDFVDGNLARINEHSKYRHHHISQGYGNTRDFFADYVARQDISHVKSWVTEEFMTTKDPDRFRFLGYYLLSKAIEVVTDPMESRYSQVYKEGRLHHLMPEQARQRVGTIIGSQHRWDAVVNVIKANLGESYSVAA